MPRYRVDQSWREIHYYTNSVIIEADSEEEAREMANDDNDMSDGDCNDSDYESDSFDVHDIVEVDENGIGIRRVAATTVSTPEPIKRNLPGWF